MVTVLHLKRRDGARATVIVDLAGREAVQRACDALQWNVSDVTAEVAKEVPCYVLSWESVEVGRIREPEVTFGAHFGPTHFCPKCKKPDVQCTCGT